MSECHYDVTSNIAGFTCANAQWISGLSCNREINMMMMIMMGVISYAARRQCPGAARNYAGPSSQQ